MCDMETASLAAIKRPQTFTTANAREMALRAAAAKRKAKEIAEKAIADLRKVTPQSENLAREISRIEELMSKTRNPDRLQKLSAAHARLFNAWQVLTGTPNPGSRKASRTPRSGPVSPILPTEPESSNLQGLDP